MNDDDDQRQLWLAWAAGEISDDEANAAAERAHAARQAARSAPKLAQIMRYMPRRPQRSPDRQRSLERRRRLAASGPMPPSLAAMFTTGELSVMRIIADEARQHGGCRLHLDAIAARAGTCRTTVQNALRAARRLGLVSIEERRRRGQPSLTNVVRIRSPEWRLWLDRGGRVQNFEHRGYQEQPSRKKQWKTAGTATGIGAPSGVPPPRRV